MESWRDSVVLRYPGVILEIYILLCAQPFYLDMHRAHCCEHSLLLIELSEEIFT
jgi:hypothetical protein